MKRLLFLTLLTFSVALFSQSSKTLKVKGTVRINYSTFGTKNPEIDKLIFYENSKLILNGVVLVVNKTIYSPPGNISIVVLDKSLHKDSTKGEILLKGKSNFKHSQIHYIEEYSSFDFLKLGDNDLLQVWSLDGQPIINLKYSNIRGKKFPCNRYDIRVKGRRFMSNFLLGSKK